MIDFSGFEYAEIRIEETETLFVQLKDEMMVVAGKASGSSARVLKEGAWGFAATDNSETDINELLKKAERLAMIGGGVIKITNQAHVRAKKIEQIEWADTDEMSARIKDAKEKTKLDGIATANLSFLARKAGKVFLNSTGAEIEQECAHFYFSCTAIAKGNGRTVQGSETAAKRSNCKKMDFEKVAETAGRSALTQLTSKPSPKGKFTVVLDPRMTGTFIHEVVGHAAEADAITNKESVFAGKLGQQVGTELVNVYDDPTLPYFGGYDYDDEGVKGRKVTLVEKGILRGFMNSNETATELGQALNGHARAEGYGERPIVRMSNTFFSPGKSTLEEVFDIREGVYVKGSAGGSVDVFSGGFMFKAKEGYLIKNGELGERLRDVAIIGDIFEVLNNIDAVGNDFETHPGICGKHGQRAFVEDGGPHIRVGKITLG